MKFKAVNSILYYVTNAAKEDNNESVDRIYVDNAVEHLVETIGASQNELKEEMQKQTKIVLEAIDGIKQNQGNLQDRVAALEYKS